MSTGLSTGRSPVLVSDWDTDRSTVLGRVFLILAAYAGGGSVLSLAELTARTNLPKSTVHRFCRVLTSAGIMEQRQAGYRLGVRLFEFGQLVPARRVLGEIALPHMQDVYEATRKTVYLSVLDQLEVVYIERVSGHKEANVPARVGWRMPLHCTASGKALLAGSDSDLFERMLEEKGLPARTPSTITTPSVLRHEIDEARQRGVAMDREESLQGISGAAAPIYGAHGRAFAAISAVGPSSRIVLDRVAPVVQTAARALSRNLIARGVYAD
jgi:DNA-binding IclR family transcriptional regulator